MGETQDAAKPWAVWLMEQSEDVQRAIYGPDYTRYIAALLKITAEAQHRERMRRDVQARRN